MGPKLIESIDPLRRAITAHPLYSQIKSLADLRIFMEHHVFAVWDFMSLLKALQRELTCVRVPWLPADATLSRLINAIVLDEESDVDPDGLPISHFSLYLRSMEQCGANTAPIELVLEEIRQGSSVSGALAASPVEPFVRDFVNCTFELIETGRPHVIAAAFTYGREDLLPGVFRQTIHQMNRDIPQVSMFHYYLNRHIEMDVDEHGPGALAMIERLCGHDEQKWREATEAAACSLQARLALWDGIAGQINRAH